MTEASQNEYPVLNATYTRHISYKKNLDISAILWDILFAYSFIWTSYKGGLTLFENLHLEVMSKHETLTSWLGFNIRKQPPLFNCSMHYAEMLKKKSYFGININI